MEETDRILEHSHVSSIIRGVCHSSCNLILQERRTIIPVFAHNSRNYDHNLLLGELTSDLAEEMGECSFLPKSSNKVRTMSFGVYKFQDSFEHLSASLQKLVTILPDDHDFPFLKQAGFIETENQSKLLRGKMPFPYEYLSGFHRLESKARPTKNDFFDTLNQTSISAEDYAKFCEIWDTFEIRTFKEMVSLYVKTDVYLLAEVLWKYSRFMYDHFHLAALKYISISGLGFDSALRWTGVELDAISDPSMYEFFTKSLTGGLACVNVKRVLCDKLPDPELLSPPPPPPPTSDPMRKPTYACFLDLVSPIKKNAKIIALCKQKRGLFFRTIITVGPCAITTQSKILPG